MTVVTMPAAVLMVADAESEVQGPNVGAKNVGACGRPAKQAQGEDGGDQQFHERFQRCPHTERGG
jgi:hypothetical protein